MGVGAGGGRPLPQGGSRGHTREIFENKYLFTLFKIFIVISYLVELFYF